MEMCYDGALVMPSSYALMNEDEMMYVEGGSLRSIAESILCGLVSCAIWEYRKSIVSATVKGVIRAYGWISALVSSAAKWAIANPAVAAGILGGCVGFVAGVTYARLRKKKK